MKDLTKQIVALKKTEISKKIKRRIKEFEKIRKNKDKIFSELCFCLLTANFQAEKSMKLQEKLEKNFFEDKERELAEKLKKEGHRFWPQRAKCIVLARRLKEELIEKINKENEKELREWLVKNVYGLGMKEASHFLRNIGFKDIAIIDFHIVDLLVKEKIIERPKTLTKKRYLEIENVLREVAKKTKLSLAELDLYLWFIETKKVLK